MSSFIAKNILKRSESEKLLSLLVQDLSGSELSSLLLEVFRQRSQRIPAAELLRQYQKNRFVQPADLPVMQMKQMEIDVLSLFARHSFQPIELSPVAVFGACSVVSPTDQNKILSAIRGTEVLADATNSIALHVSDLKKNKQWIPASAGDKIRFSTIQRHIRAQAISSKGFTPHFKIGCLVTCGRDTGQYTFEKESLSEHVAVMLSLYREYYQVEDIRFRLLCRDGYDDPMALAERLKDHLVNEHKISVEVIAAPEKSNHYYKGVQYKIDIKKNGKQFEIGDGGFVDWTQQLLQNKKERMLSTGIGFDFMYRILEGKV
jgi:hypothetical protein